MNIQFALDPYACGQYIVNYINKTNISLNKLLMNAAKDIYNGNKTIKENLRKIANVGIC